MATVRHLRLGKCLAAVNGISQFAGVYRGNQPDTVSDHAWLLAGVAAHPLSVALSPQH